MKECNCIMWKHAGKIYNIQTKEFDLIMECVDCKKICIYTPKEGVRFNGRT